MSLISDRRRVIALMGLLFAGLLPVRPLRAQESSPPRRMQIRPKPLPSMREPSRSSECQPPKDESFEKGSWKGIVHEGSGVATFGSGDTAWRIRNSPIFKLGNRRLMLHGWPRIDFGADKPNAMFGIALKSAWGPAGYGQDEDEEGGGIQTKVDEPPPGIEIDRLEGRTIRLFASDQEIGRFTPADLDLSKNFESEPPNKLLDALRRDEPIRASVLVEGQELVFFDATPVATKEAIDEMQRLVLNQKSQIDQLKHRCCFLTTACCEAVGLPDDCFELSVLRRYRDQVLSRMPQGPRDIARYYVIAPAILGAIRREGSDRALLRLYFSHILPCAVLAWLGARSLPRLLYADMMTRLCRRHAPAVAGIIVPDD